MNNLLYFLNQEMRQRNNKIKEDKRKKLIICTVSYLWDSIDLDILHLTTVRPTIMIIATDTPAPIIDPKSGLKDDPCLPTPIAEKERINI